MKDEDCVHAGADSDPVEKESDAGKNGSDPFAHFSEREAKKSKCGEPPS